MRHCFLLSRKSRDFCGPRWASQSQKWQKSLRFRCAKVFAHLRGVHGGRKEGISSSYPSGLANSPTSYRSLSGPSGPKCPGECPRGCPRKRVCPRECPTGCLQAEKKKTYTTTTERNLLENFSGLKENFPGRWWIEKPYKNQESHIHHQNISSVDPIFFCKEMFCTGAGRCMVFVFPVQAPSGPGPLRSVQDVNNSLRVIFRKAGRRCLLELGSQRAPNSTETQKGLK